MSQILDRLLKQFDGAHIVNIAQAGAIIGLKQQSTYNSIHKGAFPLPIIKVGSHRGVRVADIAEFLDSLAPLKKEIKIKRGRPTKKEQMERQKAMHDEKGGF